MGSLIAEKIKETIPRTTAEMPTVITVLVGFGTQTCCRMSDEDDCDGGGEGFAVVDGEVLGEVEGEGETDEEGLVDGVALESEITEIVPEPWLATNISPLAES